MGSNITKEEIFKRLKEILIEDFEIQEALLKPEAELHKELDMDSIDIVDLAVRLQEFTDKKVTPEEFKKIKTLDDVVNTVYKLMQ